MLDVMLDRVDRLRRKLELGGRLDRYLEKFLDGMLERENFGFYLLYGLLQRVNFELLPLDEVLKRVDLDL